MISQHYDRCHDRFERTQSRGLSATPWESRLSATFIPPWKAWLGLFVIGIIGLSFIIL